MQAIDGVMRELRGGDLKLRVRALEVERAARRASILQVRRGLCWLFRTLLPELLAGRCMVCTPLCATQVSGTDKKLV